MTLPYPKHSTPEHGLPRVGLFPRIEISRGACKDSVRMPTDEQARRRRIGIQGNNNASYPEGRGLP